MLSFETYKSVLQILERNEKLNDPRIINSSDLYREINPRDPQLFLHDLKYLRDECYLDCHEGGDDEYPVMIDVKINEKGKQFLRSIE